MKKDFKITTQNIPDGTLLEKFQNMVKQGDPSSVIHALSILNAMSLIKEEDIQFQQESADLYEYFMTQYINDDEVNRMIKEEWDGDPRILQMGLYFAEKRNAQYIYEKLSDAARKQIGVLENYIIGLDKERVLSVADQLGMEQYRFHKYTEDIEKEKKEIGDFLHNLLVFTISQPGSLVLRYFDKEDGPNIINGFVFQDQRIRSLSKYDLKEAMEMQPDGSKVPLAENEKCERAPIVL